MNAGVYMMTGSHDEAQQGRKEEGHIVLLTLNERIQILIFEYLDLSSISAVA